MDELIKIDLYGDWIEIIRGKLQAIGHTPPASAEEAAIRFFELARRLIEPKPRVVRWATNLSCPAPHQVALDEIARKAAVGEDLTPHLSRRLRDLHYDDPLLNDWGLHHFHLSTTVEPDGFVTRTRPVLFARTTDELFLMIAILEHGKGVLQPWATKLLLETILQEWPDQLNPIPGVGGLLDQPSEDQHIRLRKRVILAVQLSDGRVYGPLGGGSTSAGTSSEAVDAHDHWAVRLKTAEQFVRKNVERLRAHLQTDQVFGKPPAFKLGFHGDRICVIEITAKVKLVLE